MRSRILVGLIAGTIGGFLGWFLQENLIRHEVIKDVLTGHVQIVPLTEGQVRTLVFCVGGLIGLFLGTVDGIVEGNRRKLGQGIVIGAVAGIFVGYVGFFVGGYLYNLLGGGDTANRLGMLSFARQVIARTLGWAMMGLALGAGSAFSTRSPRRVLNGAIGGLIGGFLGGFIFDMVAQAALPAQSALGASGIQETGGASRAIGFTVIGSLTGFFANLVDELLKQAWVKVLAGKNEGKDFILSKTINILGRDERADVPLFGDMSVGAQHAAIRAERSRHFLLDGGITSGTMVNGQRVAGEVLLRDGDMIQIGTHRILFREKATQAKFAKEPLDVAKPNPVSNVAMPSHLCPFCGSPKSPDGSCKCSVNAPNSMGMADTALHDFVVAPIASPSGAGAFSGSLVSRLTVMEGVYTGNQFPLQMQTTGIGREIGREILLVNDLRVSRFHARIVQENGTTVLYDNNSSNGTFVNGVRVTMQVLAPGDIVQIGDTKFRCE